MNRKSFRRFGLILALALGAALALNGVNAIADNYAYDALGRLTRVERATGGNTTYAYDAAGNRTQVSGTTQVSCINSACSGTNSIVFPTRNATNAFQVDPYFCAGTWSTNTVGSNYFSSCSTGWTAASCSGIANCPDNISNPPQTTAACINSQCEGQNTVVGPVTNADGVTTGSQKYLCTGRWWVNTSGSNFLSNCPPPGWQPYP